eukprot:SAG25_NODE_3374_length_1106_cov_1.826216_1_plen_75_part_00
MRGSHSQHTSHDVVISNVANGIHCRTITTARAVKAATNMKMIPSTGTPTMNHTIESVTCAAKATNNVVQMISFV